MSNRKNWNEEKQAEFLATTQHTYEQAHRATGRTSRMLLEAVRLASEGHDVLVTAHSNEYARMLSRQIREIIHVAFDRNSSSTGILGGRIRIGKGSVSFTTHDRVDNFLMNCRGIEITVLSDHFRGNNG